MILDKEISKFMLFVHQKNLSLYIQEGKYVAK